MKLLSKFYKKIPSYWWDFDGDSIIVESDHAKFPIVGRFRFNPYENKGIGCATKAIEKAETLIENLEAGRISPKALLKNLSSA